MIGLDEFAAAPRIWKWGAVDCSLFVADWVAANGHPDPAAHLRGTYASEDACRAVVVKAGGLVPIFEDCAARAGLVAETDPAVGSVAVIGAAHRLDRQWGAIWDGHHWLVLWGQQDRPAAVIPFSARALKIWSV